jgi:hypothetical protein
VEARDEVGHRGLAGAAAADERDHRAAGHGDVKSRTTGVPSRYSNQTFSKRSSRTFAAPARAGTVRLVRGHPEHLEHALHRGQRPLQLGERVHDVPHRLEQQERVPLERHDVADRRAAAQVEEPPYQTITTLTRR